MICMMYIMYTCHFMHVVFINIWMITAYCNDPMYDQCPEDITSLLIMYVFCGVSPRLEVTRSLNYWGHTQLICCLSDAPVYIDQSGKKSGKPKINLFKWKFSKHFVFSSNFLPVFPIIFISLGPLKWVQEKSEKQYNFKHKKWKMALIW